MPKVLIVDDDRTNSGLLRTLLELEGFEVVLAPDGTTALARAAETTPDAFVVDFNLIDIDGTQFVRRLRAIETFKQAPVIMASGMDREEEAIDAGADHFLYKPYDLDELMSLLHSMLEH